MHRCAPYFFFAVAMQSYFFPLIKYEHRCYEPGWDDKDGDPFC